MAFDLVQDSKGGFPEEAAVRLRSKKVKVTQQRREKNVQGRETGCARALSWHHTAGPSSSVLANQLLGHGGGVGD